jgi:uncharacterized protein YcbK (DUF882 family)
MNWPTPYFSRAEFACKCGCGQNTIDYEVVAACIAVREHFDRPVRITSGVRCKAHNKAVGGSRHSQHLFGRAADIVVDGVPAEIVQQYADENLGVKGLGSYDSFTHIDSRNGRARWDG